MPLFGFAGKRPANLGVTGGALAACSSSPNGVSSDARDRSHAVLPYQLADRSDEGWAIVREAVAAWPRTHIANESTDYLRAECHSAFFGFVDDFELHLRSDGTIAVRSAARLGHSDLGVNRRRVERLRQTLTRLGALREPPHRGASAERQGPSDRTP